MTDAHRTVVIVQARMGSTRLPGKVLMPLAGKPMVVHVLERARRVAGVDEVIAAIPTLPEDDELSETIEGAGFAVSRGSPDDVLSRYMAAAEASGATTVMRVTADCPMLSPRVSGRVLAAFKDCDYASNTLTRTYPRGLDTEVMSTVSLRTAHLEATTASEREHVTAFIWRNPGRFRLRQVVDRADRSAMRWTVDTPEDMALARAIFGNLGAVFETEDVLSLLERRPELAELNRGSTQKPIT